ncbi:ester cyclase [Maritimibacter fusiformis]|uniref:Ester cyclase n=1 Tax=Maritimibacter fusiformis TaxID=2603819 RepID=A0A5D0RR57_9RHOB|nr:ester cyclase [Maritimibacter fusiformis]TYB83426.1 ester cyclase [Maritimibacter fusiformis]
MKGFQDKFTDLPDYIIKITKEIWEDRGLATLNHYYAPDVIMRSPGGVLQGNVPVIQDTVETLCQFPDKQLLAEDVIWSGDDDEGYLSSHRVLTYGTHTGFGRYGPPTGRKFVTRAMADCAAKDDVIYDEWVLGDTSGLMMQLGIDPIENVRDRITQEGGPQKARMPFTPATDVKGRYNGKGNDNEWGQKLAELLTRIMNSEYSVIQRDYDRAVYSEHPGMRTGWSWAFAETEWMHLRASFPSAKFELHHVIGREDKCMPPRAAVRWSLTGKHDGWGRFGKPSGADVHIMGITHVEFGLWGLRREWTLFDEASIWKQILIHSGSHD